MLARRWFLILLVIGIGLAWTWPTAVRSLVDPLPTRGVVAVALFLVAWGLDSRQLARAVARPWAVLWALVISFGLLPLLGMAVAPLLPGDDLRIGLAIILSGPCTMASAILWTRLADGDEAVAVLVVLLTTGLSWLVTPLWLMAATGAGVDLDPREMMAGLFVVLVLPVAFGQLVRALPAARRAVTRHRTAIGVVSRLLVLAVILKAVVGLPEHADKLTAEVLGWTLLVTMGCHLAAVAAGLWGSRGAGLGRTEATAVAFSGSQKALPVALLIYETTFKAAFPLAVLPPVLYHVGQLVVDTFVADSLSARHGGRGRSHTNPKRKRGTPLAYASGWCALPLPQTNRGVP